MWVDSKEDGLTNVESRDCRNNLIRVRSWQERYLVFRFVTSLFFSAVYKDGGIVHEMHTYFEKSVVEIELNENDNFS